MQTSGAGLDLIKKHEGFSSKIYICPAGKITIGYGHVVKSTEKFPPSGITIECAENLLRADLISAESSINKLVLVPITQNQFDALASFVFNIGAGAFAKSKLLRIINEENYEQAANEFKRWVFAGGRVQNGLIARRLSENALFNAAG